jgi:hypothetical protein
VRQGLGDLGNQVDIWSGSLEHELAQIDASVTLHGAKVLMDYPIPVSAATQADWHATFESMCEAMRSGDALSPSVVPRLMRLPLLQSTAILFCYRQNINVSEALSVIGTRAAVAAHIAAERARRSAWGSAAVAYCESVAASSEAAVSEYLVQPGDTLSRIVRGRYEMAFERLWPVIKSLNPRLTDPNLIIVGQRLLLPHLNEDDLNRARR